ncbi:MAG: hypothetical protein S4CHLAM2_16660 [Chlamydiales bacterium]|nr:hypothetical protein [Chlamydiales bacterium]
MNLENPILRSFAIEDPEGFLQTHGRAGGVIFDEAQRAPDLFSYIQVLVSAPDQCYLIYGGNEDEKRSLAQVRSWQKASTVFEA